MEIFGWISTVCFNICYLPQLYKIYRTKDVYSINVYMWYLQFIAHLTGLFYAVNITSFPLIINFIFGLFYSWLGILMYWVYRDPDKEYVRKILRDIKKELK